MVQLRHGPCVTRDHTVLLATHTRTIPCLYSQPQGITALWLCAYPQRDGQAELTWVADYIQGKCHAPGIERGYGHPSQYKPGRTYINFVDRSQHANHYARQRPFSV